MLGCSLSIPTLKNSFNGFRLGLRVGMLKEQPSIFAGSGSGVFLPETHPQVACMWVTIPVGLRTTEQNCFARASWREESGHTICKQTTKFWYLASLPVQALVFFYQRLTPKLLACGLPLPRHCYSQRIPVGLRTTEQNCFARASWREESGHTICKQTTYAQRTA
jgi:hypothetical protein